MERPNADRGFIKRVGATGVIVIMYKDEPGVYYAPDGSPASEKSAASAGFDVEALRVDREKFAAIKRAMSDIETRFRDAKSTAIKEVRAQIEEAAKRVEPEKKGEMVQTGAKEFEVKL